MTSEQKGSRTSGCAWVVVALVLATVGSLYGNSRIISAWHSCLGQDHEPGTNTDLLTAMIAVWAVMLTVLLGLGAVLGPLPKSRWYRWPVMVAVAAVLTWLYVSGTVSPAPMLPGDPADAACRPVPPFPFTG